MPNYCTIAPRVEGNRIAKKFSLPLNLYAESGWVEYKRLFITDITKDLRLVEFMFSQISKQS